MTEKRYYTAKDISEILSIGKSKAYELMHGFEIQGQLFRSCKTLRVRAVYFEEWLKRQEVPKQKLKTR